MALRLALPALFVVCCATSVLSLQIYKFHDLAALLSRDHAALVSCRAAVLDKEGDTSILKTKEASYVNGKLVLNSYLDKYPFPLYILLNHVEALPETLADALRQWFELLQRETAT